MNISLLFMQIPLISLSVSFLHQPPQAQSSFMMILSTLMLSQISICQNQKINAYKFFIFYQWNFSLFKLISYPQNSFPFQTISLVKYILQSTIFMIHYRSFKKSGKTNNFQDSSLPILFSSQQINQKEILYFVQQLSIKQLVVMGTRNSRVIQYSQISYELSKCHLLQARNCPIYGQINFVRYNQMNFYLAQSHSLIDPPLNALHYLVKPDLLLVPQFTLLQAFKPNSLQILLRNLSSICQMCGVGVGLGYRKIATASNKWGIVGERDENWLYQKALQGNWSASYCYMSPKMMLSLSQRKKHPRHNLQKSDVFILGIMAIQLLFGENLSNIFNFSEFQIKLKPILLKLNKIQKCYGDTVYQLFLGMVQIEQEYRFCFTEVKKQITLILETQIYGNKKKSNPNNLYQQSTVRNQDLSKKIHNKNKVPSFIINKQNYSNNKSNTSRNSSFNKVTQVPKKSQRSLTARQKQTSHSVQKNPSQNLFQRRQNRTHSFYRTPKKEQSLLIPKKSQREATNDFSPFRLSLSIKERENQSLNNLKSADENEQVKDFLKKGKNERARQPQTRKKDKCIQNTAFENTNFNCLLVSPKQKSKQVKFNQTLEDYSPIQLR